MATPITWRNVQGPSLSEASRPMQLAQMGMGASLDQFGQVIAQREAQNQMVLDRGREELKNSYLDTLQGAKTPEELAALRMSGVLDQRLQALDPRSRAAVRGADEARTDSLFQRADASLVRGDAALARTEAPIRDAFLSAVYSGDEAKQREILTANPNLKNMAPLIQADKAAEAQLKASLLADKDRAYRDDMRNRFEIPTAQMNLERGQANFAEEGRVRGEAATERALQSTLSAAQQGYQEQKATTGKALGTIASRLGFPVDQAGMPRVADMTEAQLIKLNSEAIINNLPTASDYAAGDTKAGNQYFSELASSGQFNPATLQKFKSSIVGAFNSTTPGPVGNDAAAVALGNARNKVAFDEQDANNWYAPGSPDAVKAYEGLSAEIPKMIPDEKNARTVQATLYKLANEGIKLEDGTTVVPSKQDIIGAIRSTTNGMFSGLWGDSHGDNVEEALKAALNTPAAAERIRKGAESQAFRTKEKLRDILYPKPAK